jgi:hypothetical protein
VPLQVGTRFLVPTTDPGGGGGPDPDPGTGPGTNPGGGGSGGPTGGTTTPTLPLPASPPGYGEGLVDQAVLGSGDAQPRGLEVTLEYNGLRFNNTKTVDKIRITQIDGLADPDIRDSRDVNPSAHGETTYPSYYGGRTITLAGRIEAYSLDKLRDMQQALKQTFNDISRERALIFRTPDPRDDIMLICKKSTAMTMIESQADYRFFRDFLITLRASNPRFLSYLVQSSSSSFSFLDSFTSASALDGYDIYTLS